MVAENTRIAGFEISRLDNTVIISTGAENGFPGCLMLSKIKDGTLSSQIVINKKDLVAEVKKYSGVQWVSRLSISRLNLSKILFYRNPSDKKLIALF